MDRPIVSHDEWLAARWTNYTASQTIGMDSRVGRLQYSHR